ncbi:D-glucuronyl C5-epimerase B-like [Saccoglossus kowalevskii]|uniref:heparosan-N-sulfate-glucuronate 5-epimerase n=1 Tax=Saccoglossus kowalevskii TaxID=10224 RepID=A0ABM0GKZ1_SACKO|nr:PREDICTED: D-glucuronyl C5-epimerase-like isoform X1 [Saccoglossus kowalevskii]XP_006813330.1 PREDICTED: D-glucuronyl C5-epimerase-like isoform X2 [Saccoglossus kowalevskii]XP_006813331.1 PREDICTED: D-glucuronyl C5-epimerase-like isoform X3 [Saccoglossus kowalevskii]
MRVFSYRANFKHLSVASLLFALVILVLYSKCNNERPQSMDSFPLISHDHDPGGRRLEDSGGGHELSLNNQNGGSILRYQPIECVINSDYTIEGRREGAEVFLPFSFIEKYFEVYGKIAEYDGYERFEWQHSYSKIYYPKEQYKPDGIFMSFDHYNVELRDRVKCISGIEGVPISTQWGPQGYFYPIQIAQFGLSHYSKNLTEQEPRVIVYENGENTAMPGWLLGNTKSHVENVLDEEKGSRVIEFITDTGSPSVTLNLKNSEDFELSFDFKCFDNCTILVILDTSDKDKYFHIHYTTSREAISRRGTHIYYGLGSCRSWRTFTRDLLNDLRKGVGQTNGKSVKKAKVSLRSIVKLSVQGFGRIDNVKLSTTAHMAHFYDAANWLLNNQDKKGGWPIWITRILIDEMGELPPGWYSAMAQGHAMSVLVRAYRKSGKPEYLKAALKATYPFNKLSSQGGVKAVFLDKYPWYEEYPTNPSSFVLNGFIYSLIGLYDLMMTASDEDRVEAERLYREGLTSLKALLPLYDTGSGTVYDLRHITTGVAPKLARWDYHTTHISQLQLLSSIEKNSLFQNTLERWIEYMKGKRAKHN